MRYAAILTLALLLAAQLAAALTGPGHGGALGVAVRGGEGLLVRVEVTLAEGEGRVAVEGVRHDALLEESVRLAVYRAAIDAGLDPYSLDYTVVVEPEKGVPALEGPSLALAVYAATAEALGLRLAVPGAVYTGTVMVDGVVGIVGGVPGKMEAVAEAGVGTLFIPLMQEAAYRVVEEDLLVGITLIETRSLITEPLPEPPEGLEIVEAGTTLDVASRPPVGEPAECPYTGVPEEVVSLIELEAERMATDALERLETSMMPPWMIESAKDRALEALTLLSNATTVEQVARAYASASYAYYMLEAWDDPEGAYRTLHSSVSMLLEAARGLEPQSVDAPGAYLLGTSRYSQEAAARTVENALIALRAYQAGLMGLQGYAQSIARSAYQAGYHSATALMSAAAATPGGLGEEDVEKLVDLASLLCDYSIHYSQRTGVASDMVPLACSHSARARTALARGDWPLAAYHAVEAIALAIAFHDATPGIEEVAWARLNETMKSLEATPAWSGVCSHWLVRETLDRMHGAGLLDRLYLAGRLHAITILSTISGGEAGLERMVAAQPPGGTVGGEGGDWRLLLLGLLGVGVFAASALRGLHGRTG